MSQSAPASDVRVSPDVSEIGHRPSKRQSNEFRYRPVPVLAPVALFLGICSVIGLTTIAGLGISLMGTILALICLSQIRRADGEMGGKLLAIAGFVLSFLFLVSGSALHAFTIATEVPDGFKKINFSYDISRKGFVFEDGQSRPHPDVRKLEGQKIFIKGYMYPMGQTYGIPEFLLVKDNQQCCFGGQPKITDMILVKMQDGKTVEDQQLSLVSVAGVFRNDPQKKTTDLTPVFVLEATFFEPSKTSF